MTRVCLVGCPEVNLQYELLSRETSRDALATYDLERPFENAIALRTVSVGAAVSLLNDLQWYLVRFVDEAFVQEPSVSDEEWLSRGLAEALRNGDTEPEETGEFLKVYGLERSTSPDDPDDSDPVDYSGPGHDDSDFDGDPNSDEVSNVDATASGSSVNAATTQREPPSPRLVEPLYVRRTDGEIPEYDLRDVEETLVVRLTEAEFSP